MTELNFYDTGCEPAKGPKAGLVLIRRALRRALRPTFARLAQLFAGVVERLDQAEGRIERAEERIERAEGRIGQLDAWIGRADFFLSDAKRRLDHTDVRLDEAETRLDRADHLGLHSKERLDTAEWNVRVFRQQIDGLTAHLAGLSGEHIDLNARVEERLTAGLLGRQLEEQVQAVQAMHWDHVALTRRLAAIEDRLALSLVPEIDIADRNPLIPFPGMNAPDPTQDDPPGEPKP